VGKRHLFDVIRQRSVIASKLTETPDMALDVPGGGDDKKVSFISTDILAVLA